MFKVKNNLVFALSITALSATSLTGCAKQVAEDAAPNGNNQALVEEVAPTVTTGFGSDLKLSDSVSIKFENLMSFAPSKFASNYEKGMVANKFDVTIKNNGTTDLNLTDVSFAIKSNDYICVDVLDGDNGIDGSPTDVIKPGATSLFTYGTGCKTKKGDPLKITATIGNSIVGVETNLA